jgi:hypothetical protein
VPDGHTNPLRQRQHNRPLRRHLAHPPQLPFLPQQIRIRIKIIRPIPLLLHLGTRSLADIDRLGYFELTLVGSQICDGGDVGARYEAPIDVNAGNAAEEGVFRFILYFCLYANKSKKDNKKRRKNVQ